MASYHINATTICMVWWEEDILNVAVSFPFFYFPPDEKLHSRRCADKWRLL
jgi:hypothetical protein